jgi:hypothetical protein
MPFFVFKLSSTELESLPWRLLYSLLSELSVFIAQLGATHKQSSAPASFPKVKKAIISDVLKSKLRMVSCLRQQLTPL